MGVARLIGLGSKQIKKRILGPKIDFGSDGLTPDQPGHPTSSLETRGAHFVIVADHEGRP
jgi:hypothetical protein